MKLRKTALLLAAVIAITSVMSACNIKTGTNTSSEVETVEDGTADTSTTTGTTAEPLNIPPMTDVDLSTVIAKSSVGSEFDITYGDFYKEYMFYLNRNSIEDDTTSENAQTCMDKRLNIVQYLTNEKILLHIAKEKGFDQFTDEELDKFQTDFEANLQTWYDSFEDKALAEDSTLSGTALADKCKEMFIAMLAECNLTTDDLLMWDRSSAIISKLYASVTDTVTTERSAAETYVEGLVTEAKTAFETSPTDYESVDYSAIYIPEGSRKIKHILIQFDDTTTTDIQTARYSENDTAKADSIRSEKLEALKAEADEVIAKLDAGEDYDSLMSTYSDDKSMETYYPDGYLVIPGSTRYVDEFTAGAFELENVGDYKLVASDYGYHILQYASDAVVSDEDYQSVIDEVLEVMQEYAENDAITAACKEWVAPYEYEIDYDIIRVIVEDEATAEATAETTAVTTNEADASTAETTTIAQSTTIGEKNALSKAKSYIDIMAFSYSGLVKQLEFDGFLNSEAKYGVDNCGADWNEQAALKAASYLDTMSFSRQGLIDQLVFDGFTAAQAEYGATQSGY